MRVRVSGRRRRRRASSILSSAPGGKGCCCCSRDRAGKQRLFALSLLRCWSSRVHLPLQPPRGRNCIARKWLDGKFLRDRRRLFITPVGISLLVLFTFIFDLTTRLFPSTLAKFCIQLLHNAAQTVDQLGGGLPRMESESPACLMIPCASFPHFRETLSWECGTRLGRLDLPCLSLGRGYLWHIRRRCGCLQWSDSYLSTTPRNGVSMSRGCVGTFVGSIGIVRGDPTCWEYFCPRLRCRVHGVADVGITLFAAATATAANAAVASDL